MTDDQRLDGAIPYFNKRIQSDIDNDRFYNANATLTAIIKAAQECQGLLRTNPDSVMIDRKDLEMVYQAVMEYRDADRMMIDSGYEFGFNTNEHDRAEDKFMACRKPVDEALQVLEAALKETP